MYDLDDWPEPLPDLIAFTDEFPSGWIVAHRLADGVLELYGFPDRDQALLALNSNAAAITALVKADGSQISILDVPNALKAFPPPLLGVDDWIAEGDGCGIVGYTFDCKECKRQNRFSSEESDPRVTCEYCDAVHINTWDPSEQKPIP